MSTLSQNINISISPNSTQTFTPKTPTLKALNFLKYPVNKLYGVQNKKRFIQFWNKLTRVDRQRVILLIGIDHKPVPSLTHLKAELFLVKNCYNEEWTYGGIE